MNYHTVIRTLFRALRIAALGLPLISGTSMAGGVAAIMVLNANDSGPGSLRDAIALANATAGTQTIAFDPIFFATPQTILLTTGELVIPTSMIIMGPGANLVTVSGNNASRVFKVTDNTPTILNVTLKGLTVTGGNDTNGAGIWNFERLTVLDSIVISNTATAAGGGIASSGLSSKLTLNNTKVLSNNAINGPGGGIYILQTSSSGATAIDIQKSTISGNQANGATGDGGGIMLQSPTSPVLIATSTIANNTAAQNGGGLNIGSTGPNGLVTVRATTISGNTANSTVNRTGSVASGGGGGIYVGSVNTLVNIENCTISNNIATNEDGGGLFVYDDPTASDTNDRALLTRLRGTTVAENHAPDADNDGSTGGGIFIMTDVILLNVIVANNTVNTPATDSDLDNDKADDRYYSEYSLFEIADASIRDYPGQGTTGDNIRDPEAYRGLGPLQNNGGDRLTHALNIHALEAGIDRGGNGVCSTPGVRYLDGRGARRPVDGNEDLVATCDMGAYEFNGRVAPCPASPSPGCTAFNTGSVTLTRGITKTGNSIIMAFGGTSVNDDEFFGYPISYTGTANAFCVYDGTNTLVAQVALEAGEVGKTGLPLWKQVVSKTIGAAGSLVYANSLGNADGAKTVSQIAGVSPLFSTIAMTASGVNSTVPLLPLNVTGGLKIQDIMSNGNCAEVSFTSGQVLQTGSTILRAIKLGP